MAGTLTISTLSDGTNSTSSTNCIQGSAKAWVNFIGSTAVIRASYNVSSITRTGTGTYTVNFTNAFSDANYAFTMGVEGSGMTLIKGSDTTAPTTTTLAIATFTGATFQPADPSYAMVSVFR